MNHKKEKSIEYIEGNKLNDIKDIHIEYNTKIRGMITRGEEINIEIIGEYKEKIENNIKEYNELLKGWYNKEYEEDIERLKEEITIEDKKIERYKQDDYIII